MKIMIIIVLKYSATGLFSDQKIKKINFFKILKNKKGLGFEMPSGFPLGTPLLAYLLYLPQSPIPIFKKI